MDIGLTAARLAFDDQPDAAAINQYNYMFLLYFIVIHLARQKRSISR